MTDWQGLIVTNWNRYIQPGDIVFHLGDLALGKKDNLETLLEGLNGKLYLMCSTCTAHPQPRDDRIGARCTSI